ncbi:hypothetical protein J7K18_08125 [bacterium]|nr:hypothetical protein [bacterium]
MKQLASIEEENKLFSASKIPVKRILVGTNSSNGEEKLKLLLPRLKGKKVVKLSTEGDGIVITKKDVNIFNVPRKRILERIRSERFELFIDLCDNFFFPVASAPVVCRIPYRVSFSNNVPKPYANIILPPLPAGIDYLLRIFS